MGEPGEHSDVAMENAAAAPATPEASPDVPVVPSAACPRSLHTSACTPGPPAAAAQQPALEPSCSLRSLQGMPRGLAWPMRALQLPAQTQLSLHTQCGQLFLLRLVQFRHEPAEESNVRTDQPALASSRQLMGENTAIHTASDFGWDSDQL